MPSRLVIGLGNPGQPYSETRHNLGFQVLDRLAALEGLGWQNSKPHQSACAPWPSPSGEVLLVKPLTFMNLSGRAVRSLRDTYKIPTSEILVVCDDCNLPLGELRVRPNGSSGGHNGLQSVADHLQTTEFARLRLGIGPGKEGVDLSDYVLARFLPEEKALIDNLTNRAVLAIKASSTFSIEEVMNEFNRKQSD